MDIKTLIVEASKIFLQTLLKIGIIKTKFTGIISIHCKEGGVSAVTKEKEQII